MSKYHYCTIHWVFGKAERIYRGKEATVDREAESDTGNISPSAWHKGQQTGFQLKRVFYPYL